MKNAISALCFALFLLAGGEADAARERAIPCILPVQVPLRLTVLQHMWLANGKAATATVTRSLRFVPMEGGMAVEARIEALTTDEEGEAGARARDRLALAYGAPGEVRIKVLLDAGRAIRGVESLDALWLDFRTRQARLNKAMMQGGKINPRTDAMLRTLDSMGDPERIAILTAFLSPILRYCGTVAPSGMTIADSGLFNIESRVDSPGMSDVSRYVVDGRTGLLRTLERNISIVSAPMQPLREEWTLSPE